MLKRKCPQKEQEKRMMRAPDSIAVAVHLDIAQEDRDLLNFLKELYEKSAGRTPPLLLVTTPVADQLAQQIRSATGRIGSNAP